MHIVLGIIGLLTAAYFLIIRARNAAEMTGEFMEIADDVRAAARRFGFRKKYEQHPVEAIEEPNIAAVTVATAYLEMHGLPTEETRTALSDAVQVTLDVSAKDAEELMVLGRWLMNESGGAQPAITRASKKLYALGARDVAPLMEILKPISSDPLSDQQREALHEIKRAFHIKGN